MPKVEELNTRRQKDEHWDVLYIPPAESVPTPLNKTSRLPWQLPFLDLRENIRTVKRDIDLCTRQKSWWNAESAVSRHELYMRYDTDVLCTRTDFHPNNPGIGKMVIMSKSNIFVNCYPKFTSVTAPWTTPFIVIFAFNTTKFLLGFMWRLSQLEECLMRGMHSNRFMQNLNFWTCWLAICGNTLPVGVVDGFII